MNSTAEGSSSSSEVEDADEIADLEPSCKRPKRDEISTNHTHRCGDRSNSTEVMSSSSSSIDIYVRCQDVNTSRCQNLSESGISSRSGSPRGGSCSPPAGGRASTSPAHSSVDRCQWGVVGGVECCSDGCVGSCRTAPPCRYNTSGGSSTGYRCCEGGGTCSRSTTPLPSVDVPGPSRLNIGAGFCHQGRNNSGGGGAGPSINSGNCGGRYCVSGAGGRSGGCRYVQKHSTNAKLINRTRGPSSEKEGKSLSSNRTTGHRSTSGSGVGRIMMEKWQVGRPDQEQTKIREERRTTMEGEVKGEQIKIKGEPDVKWREDRCRMGESLNRQIIDDQMSNTQCGEPIEVAKLQAKLKQRENELVSQRQENERFLRELQESVECPVCFSVPRAPPVPCCQNGHVICTRCKEKVEHCPTCRIPMTNCVSQVAATIIQRIQHPCDFRDAGCQQRFDINAIDQHEERCMYRLVRCPHWACDEMISLTSLTSHVISAECGDNYMTKPLPYQEEIEYTRALDDRDGSSFWRPSLLQFQNITFYLQIEKSGKNGQWYFFVQMEASSAECENFETRITVCKNTTSDRFSISYHGKVCSIDIKGAEELDQGACGLSVRDAVMERIFTVDTTSGQEGSKSHNGEKEEGEVGDHGEEGERYKFWVKVDIFNVDD